MSKNTGKPYEQLARDIFEQIVNQDVVETVKVEHDVILPGLRTSHQIDVYWKFRVGGIEYESVVQAKDWASTVDQGELIKFKGVLDDLPNQPRGIFVTRTGYQSGAREFAEASGILLYELREPTEQDFEGWLRTITINIKYFVPQATEIELAQDTKWNTEEMARLGLDLSNPPSMLLDGDSPVRGENGDSLGTLNEIIQSHYPTEMKAAAPQKVSHAFKQSAFIETGDPAFPRVKVSGVSFIVTVHEGDEQIVLRADDVVGFILKNVLEDEDVTFDKLGKLRQPPAS